MQRTREPLTTRSNRLAGVLGLAAAAALVGACAAPGGGATSAPTTPPATQAVGTEVPMSAPPATSGATSGAMSTIQVTANGDYGSIVTGEGGMTLYILTPDADAPGKSVCNGDCATAWPPLTVASAGDVTSTGVTAEVGTITRDDGALQVTLGGNPLYYFAGDAAAGDTKGQGLNDVWWIAGPNGEGITEKSSGEIRY